MALLQFVAVALAAVQCATPPESPGSQRFTTLTANSALSLAQAQADATGKAVMKVLKEEISIQGKKGISLPGVTDYDILNYLKEKKVAKGAASGTGTPAKGQGCPGTCIDDPQWLDAKGFYCFGWAGFSCGDAGKYGYTDAEVDALVRNCPYSCNKCCTPASSTSKCKIQYFLMDLLKKADDSGVASWLEDAIDEQKITKAGESIPCVDIQPGSCKDTLDFVDEMGAKCSEWANLDCYDTEGIMAKWSNYTANGLAALQSQCPKSCKSCVKCAATCADEESDATLAPVVTLPPEVPWRLPGQVMPGGKLPCPAGTKC